MAVSTTYASSFAAKVMSNTLNAQKASKSQISIHKMIPYLDDQRIDVSRNGTKRRVRKRGVSERQHVQHDTNAPHVSCGVTARALQNLRRTEEHIDCGSSRWCDRVDHFLHAREVGYLQYSMGAGDAEPNSICITQCNDEKLMQGNRAIHRLKNKLYPV